ncbi:MAG: MATE family efflux transporter [Limnochordia bacterium]
MSVPHIATGASKKSIRIRVLTLAWPAIVDQFLTMAVNMVDTAMVGRLGAAALAAVGLGAQVMMVATAVFSSVTTGTTALVARFIGACDPENARKTARQSLVFGGFLAFVTSVFFVLFAEQIVGVLFSRAEQDVLAGAASYVRIVGMGLIPQFLLIVTNSVLRGAGDTRTPMQITATANVVNVIGNYFLIFGIGVFPRLGLQGAAIATTIAHCVAAVLALRALFGGKKVVALSLRDDFRPDSEVLMRIFNVGIPAGMEQGVMRVGQLLFTMILSSLGTVAFAAHRIALQAESLSFMPGFGFALAATSLVGQALGAGEPEEAEHVGLEAARIAAFGMGLMGVIFLIFPRALVSVFTTDEAVIAQSAVVIRIVAVSQPFMAIHMVLAGGLRGAGDTRTVMLVSLVGICGVRLALSLLLVSLGLGLVGAWIAMTIDLILRGSLLYWRFRQGRWKEVQV